jgi:ferredoxin
VREVDRVKVIADREVCIGSGNCVLAAPQFFDQDDEVGLVVLLTPEVTPEHDTAVRDAVAHCPSGALRIVED